MPLTASYEVAQTKSTPHGTHLLYFFLRPATALPNEEDTRGPHKHLQYHVHLHSRFDKQQPQGGWIDSTSSHTLFDDAIGCSRVTALPHDF